MAAFPSPCMWLGQWARAWVLLVARQCHAPPLPLLLHATCIAHYNALHIHNIRAQTQLRRPHRRRAAVAAVQHHLERAREAAAAKVAMDGGQPVLHRLQRGRGEHAQPVRHARSPLHFSHKQGTRL